MSNLAEFYINYGEKLGINKNKPMKDNPRTIKTYFDFTTEMSAEQYREKDIKANKLLRVSLDESLQDLKDCPRSRERSLSITKLQEAIMWLGMDLKRLNEANPYPDSYKPENTKIAPTADGLKL